MTTKKKRALSIIECLCCWFEIPMLTVRMTKGRGWFRWTWRRRKGEIIGTKNHRLSVRANNIPCCLHEFAHYLATIRINPTSYHSVPHHGPAFHRALTDVAEAWYGDANKYPWDKEYKRLADAGPRS